MIPKLLFLIKSSKKSEKNIAVIQPRPTHILYQRAKFGENGQTISFKYFSWEPPIKTRASREMTSRQNNFFFFQF